MDTVKVYIESHYSAYLLTLINADGTDGADLLIQTDWDYPGIANALGIWSHPHNCTDGTVTCSECGKSASLMIEEAGNALDEHCDSIVECHSSIGEYFGY